MRWLILKYFVISYVQRTTNNKHAIQMIVLEKYMMFE